MVPNTLIPNLASLFRVDTAGVYLQKIETGLTHLSYICRVSGQQYFVKVYTPGENTAEVVDYVNRVTAHMRNCGVPASRVVRYSLDFANIVVHEFVEGEIANGDISQINAIAELYSQMTLIGAEHGIDLTKAEYLSGINSFTGSIRQVEEMGIAVDTSIQTGVLGLTERTHKFLQARLPDKGLFHVHMHDDFTEKNILMEADQVKLLCDWDAYRVKFLAEHIACTACRFSTDRPLRGELQADKLFCFLRSLDPKVLGYIPNLEEFAQLFPVLATLKHLRTYAFRNSVVRKDRPDLRIPLLAWPLEHCDWLMANHQQVSDWVWEALAGEQEGNIN